MAQRVWSSEMPQPVAQSSVKSTSIIAGSLRTKFVALLYEQATPQGPFTMLRAKRGMVLLAFELFSQSQGQNTGADQSTFQSPYSVFNLRRYDTNWRILNC
ncbi:hypothetical protein N7524_006103 [Penicillium chrysogenum]|nr:hypothetical protein N7524_008697 [Penicillium chrysogenum]KAJ5260969.1 hypothetical protein N7524_008602 [Penicillium chrysogenum]KAJ5268063.1 hypothetical protein N7524_006103 [Penicillium chrysogenum]